MITNLESIVNKIVPSVLSTKLKLNKAEKYVEMVGVKSNGVNEKSKKSKWWKSEKGNSC